MKIGIIIFVQSSILTALFFPLPVIQRYLLHLLEFPKRLLVTIRTVSASLSEVNEYFNLNLSTDDLDFDTIGGYLFHRAGTIPKESRQVGTISVKNYKFTVLEIRKKRVLKIRVEKIV